MVKAEFLKLDKDIVRVLWVDSMCRSGWREAGEACTEKNLFCESIGLLMQKTEDIVEIVPHYCEGVNLGRMNGNGNGIMIIPRGAVKRIEILKKGAAV